MRLKSFPPFGPLPNPLAFARISFLPSLLTFSFEGNHPAGMWPSTFSDGTSRIVAQFQGVTHDQQVLRADIRPKPTNVTRLRILTTGSPSWVAWGEIRIE